MGLEEVDLQGTAGHFVMLDLLYWPNLSLLFIPTHKYPNGERIKIRSPTRAGSIWNSSIVLLPEDGLLKNTFILFYPTRKSFFNNY